MNFLGSLMFTIRQKINFNMNFSDLLRQQRQYINTQQTLSIAARKSTLLRFKQMLEENEAKIYEAVHADFHK